MSTITVPRFLRTLVGHKYDTRYKWGELAWHWKHPKVKLEYCPSGMFDYNTLIVGFLFFTAYIHLPTETHGNGCFRDNEPAYGFYTIDNCIVWRWGKLYKSWSWPFFSFNHYSSEVLAHDLKRVHIRYDWEKWDSFYGPSEEAKSANSKAYPYRYTLKNGTVQERVATVIVERLTWTRKWAPFLKSVRTSIWVSFSDEVGEKTGSWKGGTTGCGYTIRKGETPLQCLRRMEAERKF